MICTLILRISSCRVHSQQKEFISSKYNDNCRIMPLRDDFSEGSALYRIVYEQKSHSIEENPEIKRGVTKRRESIDDAIR